MSRIILLDSGPLGMLARSRPTPDMTGRVTGSPYRMSPGGTEGVYGLVAMG